jgi:hypothetical protein
MFCDYKNLLGLPNAGIHSYRIGTDKYNVAAVDLSATVLVALLASVAFKTNFVITLVLLFVLGIVAHRIFCVKTVVDQYIFRD